MENTTYQKDVCDIIIENLTKKWRDSMQNKISHTEWARPKYSKSQINKAGQIIANPNSSKEERNNALEILNNWRAAHAYPLHVINAGLRRGNPNAIVVQRLKRLESITGKIERFPQMQLYKMQDLGGCRVIVDTIDQVYDAVSRYKNSRIRHILKREYDYIQNPKDSGYRCYHMVYQFQSDKFDAYNKNMLIEIQFRTKLQHTWATAVEMMGIYTKTNLKSSIGDKGILRFFTLMSSLFAIKEYTPVCPNTPERADELIDEIMELDKNNNIIMKLKAINQAVQITEFNEFFNLKNGYYLLILNYEKPSLNIKTFKPSEFDLADNIYGKMESELQNKKIDTVLVSAKSFDNLKAAYPNYFVDISDFLNILKNIMLNYSKLNENARLLLESNHYILKDHIPIG